MARQNIFYTYLHLFLPSSVVKMMANTKIIFPLAMLADFFVILVIAFLVMYFNIMNVVCSYVYTIAIAAATRHYSTSNRAYPFVCTNCGNVQERN